MDRLRGGDASSARPGRRVRAAAVPGPPAAQALGGPAAAQPRSQVPHAGGAGARRGLHGVPRPRHRRGLREPPDRGGDGVLPGGMAGGSGPLVQPHPSGRSAALERRGRRDVPDRQAAPLGLPGARARWPRRLVPVRSEDGAPRATAVPGSSTASASTSPSSSRPRPALERERNSSRRCSTRSGALVVVLSPSGAIVRFNRDVRADQRVSFDEVRGRYFWDLFPVPEEARGFRALLAGLRARAAAASTRATGPPRDGARRRIAWSSTVLPGAGARPAYIITHRDRHHRAEADGARPARDQRPGAAPDRPGPARRPGPAPDRHRVHEQGAGAAAGRGRRAGRRRTRPRSCGW